MGISVITDRTLADVTSKTVKGRYTNEDLNRVGVAVNELAALFNANGYPNTISGKTDWMPDDTPSVSQMEEYLNCVSSLRVILGTKSSTPAAPQSMQSLDHIKANDIEQILLDICGLVSGMIAEYKPLGMFHLGHNNGTI